MDNFKIISVMKTLSKKELRRFGEFVSSPFFNKYEPAVRLYDAFVRFHPGFDNRNFTIEKIYSKVFPKEEFNYSKISNVISDLYQLSERFLAQLQIESSEFYIERNILRQLRERFLLKLYEQKHSAYTKELLARKYKNEDYFFYLHELNDDYLRFATLKNANTELNVLQNEFDNFMLYTIIRRLRYYSLMLHERNQTNINYDLFMLDEMLDYISKNENVQIPIILFFKNILLLLLYKEEKFYDELWRLKEQYFEEVSPDDRGIIYLHLYDYAAYMVNFKGDDSYNRDMFNIYKEEIEQGLMPPEGFSYYNFINVVKISCRVKEFEYAKEFMKSYRSSIPEAEETNVLEFCYGTIENAKNNYESALKHISKCNFQNFILKVQVRILLLKLNYRLRRYNEAFGMIDTFRHYIAKEDNILPEHRESYNIFLRLVSELIRATELPDKKEAEYRIEKIKKEADLMPANPFRIKIWLKEELTKL